MTDEQALLRAILEAPGDDTTRLVYADALEESGDPARANVIRWMVNRPTWFADETCLEHSDDSPGYLAALDWLKGGSADGELSRQLGGAWATVDGHWVWHKGVLVSQEQHVCYARGFVARVDATWHEFMAPGFAARLFANTPVERVEIADTDPLSNGYDSPADMWFWIRAEAGEDPRRLTRWEVPRELCEEAPPPDFTSKRAAYDWLSARCVQWGRRQAGLPDLAPRGDGYRDLEHW